MIQGYIGNSILIPLQLFGGETNLYPQVVLYTSNGSILNVFNMEHNSTGLYQYIWNPTNKGNFIGIFKVYVDSTHTTLSSDYGFVSENIIILENLEDELNSIKNKTDNLTFEGNNVQSRINDKGILNNPPSENINDYKTDISNLALENGGKLENIDNKLPIDPTSETNASSNKNDILSAIGSGGSGNVELRNFNISGD